MPDPSALALDSTSCPDLAGPDALAAISLVSNLIQLGHTLEYSLDISLV